MMSFKDLNNLKLSFLLLIFFLYASDYIFSQDLSEHKSQIKLTPIKIINLLNPGFELSYERVHNGNFSTQVSVAYLVDCLRATPYEDYSGYRIMLEEKRFHFKRKSHRHYFSLEIGYYTANMINSAHFVPQGIEWGDDLYYESLYEDIFSLKRTGTIINAKYGIQVIIKHFTIDFSAGLGVIIHNITHSNRLNPNDEMDSPRHPNVYHMMEYEGKHSMPNLPLTLKLGYVF